MAYRKDNPLFDVAVKQLEATKLSKATQGCLLGVMPQARKASEDGLESALNGADPQAGHDQGGQVGRAADQVLQRLDQVARVSVTPAAAGAGPRRPLRPPRPR